MGQASRFSSQGGDVANAAIVIGADGIHSKVREFLFGQDSPQFTGCVAWRGLVPMDRLPGHLARNMATSWLGPAGHVLHYPVHRGELMNFIGFVERTTGGSSPGRSPARPRSSRTISADGIPTCMR